MAKRQPKKAITVSTHDGQVSAPGGNPANFFLRNIPLWNPPAWQEAEYWRKFVTKQPIATICRERIASYLNSLDWAIVPRDSEQRDELKGRIKYYTKLFEKGSSYYNDIDFPTHVEWLVKDLFDLPFGCAAEIGRIDDNPKGRVVWIRPLDAGTLAPTLNFDFPVIQGGYPNPVYLPKDFVARVYLSPRTEMQREGWGFAPPEKIYLAIEMLYRGDSYYAQLLLNTPEAGILDLGDMEKTSALEWVNSLRDLLYGINPLKMPVLYEHTTDAKFIPFGKPPSEIMYDSITMKYAGIVAAGYGLTLTDIGLSMSSTGGGDTLAGTIRMERISKSSGMSTAKKKIQAYWNKILPDYLKFTWIDYDDEKNVAKGRARLASAQAADVWIRNRAFKPSEIRQQAIADGLFSITIPETIDPNDEEFSALQQAQMFGKPNFGGSRGNSLGDPQSPSQGGQGEIIPQQIVQKNLSSAEVGIAKAAYGISDTLGALLSNVQKMNSEEIGIWEDYVDGYLTGKSDIEEERLKSILDSIASKAVSSIEPQNWLKEFSVSLSEKVVADELKEWQSRQALANAQAEEDRFISGESDDPTVVKAESVPVLDKRGVENAVFKALAVSISKLMVLVSKSVILEKNLQVDATEQVDNNIRVSREIAKETLRNLPALIRSAYACGRDYLKSGEQNAKI